MAGAIVDAGPLIALLDRRERHHDWVLELLAAFDPPLLTCEPVLTETLYRVSRYRDFTGTLLGLLERGALRIPLRVQDHASALRKLHEKYRDRPMSFADACVVRMAELNERHAVLTFDSDFTVYRKNGTTPLDVIYPPRQ